MYWIDLDTLKLVASENTGNYDFEIHYSDKTRRTISSYSGLLTIHTHPMGLPPSIEDLNSNFINNYGRGIVVGHTGKVFVYRSQEYIPPVYFGFKVASYELRGYNEYEAVAKTLEDCCEHYDIWIQEVLADE